MKFLFASDSFKGTLSSEKIIELLTKEARKVFPDCEAIGIPIADGGEGTLEAIVHATKGKIRQVQVHGPQMERIESSYGVIGQNTVIIEMAKASGLPFVPVHRRNPLYTTTYGTGELIKAALEEGYRKIVIAIGGSATNDGGMGAMKALGIRFLNQEGQELEGKGKNLGKVRRIDLSGLHPGINEAEILVMCDVNTPLIGKTGATYTFGPQKGGTPEILEELEMGMRSYAKLLNETFGVCVDQIPGTGAAGGLGAALSLFLQAKLQPGVETILDLIGFEQLLDGVDLVVTGEGRIDWQSTLGKVPSGVGVRCKKKGIPVVAIVGTMGKGAEKMYEYGIQSILPTVNATMELEEAMNRAEELYEGAAERLFRMIKVGTEMSNSVLREGK